MEPIKQCSKVFKATPKEWDEFQKLLIRKAGKDARAQFLVLNALIIDIDRADVQAIITAEMQEE